MRGNQTKCTRNDYFIQLRINLQLPQKKFQFKKRVMPRPQTTGRGKNNNVERVSQIQLYSSTSNRAKAAYVNHKEDEKKDYKEIIQSYCSQKLQRERESKQAGVQYRLSCNISSNWARNYSDLFPHYHLQCLKQHLAYIVDNKNLLNELTG